MDGFECTSTLSQLTMDDKQREQESLPQALQRKDVCFALALTSCWRSKPSEPLTDRLLDV